VDRRDFLKALGLTVSSIAALEIPRAPTAYAQTTKPSSNSPNNAIPDLDELAGDWWRAADLRSLPALSNFWGGLQASANIFAIEALTFPPFAQGQSTGQLSINGNPVTAAEFRWFPYQVLRRATVGDINIQTTVRMACAQRIVFFSAYLTNTGNTTANFTIDISLRALIRAYPDVTWTWDHPSPDKPDEFQASVLPGGNSLIVRDQKTSARTAFAFSAEPDALNTVNDHGQARWNVTLAPGKQKTIELAMTVGDAEAQILALAVDYSANLATASDSVKRGWQDRFNAAFTPGNTIFSGHLPVLQTSDAKLRRIYFMSVVSLLCMFRTDMPIADRVFVTNGPQNGVSLMYFWDAFTWATVFALLDPVAMKNTLRRWLNLDIHNCYAQDSISGQGVGPWYSFNDFTIYSLIERYVCVTGDKNFLQEKNLGLTVMDRLEQFATWWKKLVRSPNPMADYGAANNLLECVPTYIDVVPSLNAASVWMMRRTAELRDLTGDHAGAAALRTQADALAKEVLGLYVPGQGVWVSVHRDGRRIQMRHCIDFFTISDCMTDDLTPAMRNQMAGFVQKELITDHWMRAQSLSDPAAGASDRPDHGPMGAYDAWPPFTMEGLSRLGFFPVALDFLHRCEPTTHEGPFGQSHELLGKTAAAPVRKAHRGQQMYNCSAGTAFAEIIIRNFFGFHPEWDSRSALFAADTPRGFEGSLKNVRTAQGLITITSGPNGLSLEKKS